MALSKARQVEVAQRRAKAVAMRTAGQPWDTIAVTLGYASRGAAHSDVTAALEQARKELAVSTEQFRELELERLDNLERKVREVLERRHVHVSAGGRIVRDDDGENLKDDGPTLAAVDRLLKIAERRARLLGVDTPARVEVSGQVLYAVEGVNTEKLT